MNFSQLTFAREYRGLTQTELAQQIEGLSQSNLSKYEKGLETLSEVLLEKIMKALSFPMGFLDLDIRNKVENEEYRKKSIGAKTRMTIKRTIELIAYCYDFLLDMVDIPNFGFPRIDLSEGYSPEDVAKQVRRQFRLGDKPIENIHHLLEKNGVAVYEWDCDIDSFDGVSLITDKGNVLVVVNADMPNDRKRFTLAHELGHIIMHHCIDFIIHPDRNKEDEANRFAAELLMPSDVVRHSLCNVKLKELPLLKQYWKVSMASLVFRANALGCINYTKYTSIYTEISRNGWLKKEPIMVSIDSPEIISRAYDLVKRELRYSLDDMQHVMYIPKDIISSFFERKSVSMITLRRT